MNDKLTGPWRPCRSTSTAARPGHCIGRSSPPAARGHCCRYAGCRRHAASPASLGSPAALRTRAYAVLAWEGALLAQGSAGTAVSAKARVSAVAGCPGARPHSGSRRFAWACRRSTRASCSPSRTEDWRRSCRPSRALARSGTPSCQPSHEPAAACRRLHWPPAPDLPGSAARRRRCRYACRTPLGSLRGQARRVPRRVSPRLLSPPTLRYAWIAQATSMIPRLPISLDRALLCDDHRATARVTVWQCDGRRSPW
jgi:hypothetical protein